MTAKKIPGYTTVSSIRTKLVVIEAVFPLDADGASVARALEDALDNLRSEGTAEIIQQTFLTDPFEQATKILLDRRDIYMANKNDLNP